MSSHPLAASRHLALVDGVHQGLTLRGQLAATVIDGQGCPVSSEMLLDVLARMGPKLHCCLAADHHISVAGPILAFTACAVIAEGIGASQGHAVDCC